MAGESTIGLAPAAIQGGAGILGSVVGGLFGNYANRQAYKRSKKLMELQNQFNIEQWERNNEYNTPKMQMQRYMDAGLNPNLIYGNGTNGNSSSPVESAGYQQVDPAHYDTTQAVMGIQNAVNTYMQYQQMESNIRAQDAQSALYRSQADYYTSQTSGQNTKNWILEQTKEKEVERVSKIVEESTQRISESKANVDFIKSRLRLNDKEAEKINAEIANLSSVIIRREFENKLTQSQTASNWKDLDLKDSIIERNGYLNQNTIQDTLSRKYSNIVDRYSVGEKVMTNYYIMRDCLYRSKNGQIQFDKNKYQLKYYKRFGVEKPTDLGSYGGSMLGLSQYLNSITDTSED